MYGWSNVVAQSARGICMILSRKKVIRKKVKETQMVPAVSFRYWVDDNIAYNIKVYMHIRKNTEYSE